MKKATVILYIVIFALGFWVEMPSFERSGVLVSFGALGLLLLMLPSLKWFEKHKNLKWTLIAISPMAVFALEQQSRYSINDYFQMLYFAILIGVYQYSRVAIFRLVAILSVGVLSWKYIHIMILSPDLFKLPQFIVALSLYGLVAVILWLGLKLNNEKYHVFQLNRALEERQVSLENTNNQLEKLMEELESLTVYRERQKMAREIHDTVGHELTALTMKLELCKHFSQTDPEKGNQMLQESIDDSRKALRLTRQVVETLTTARRSAEDFHQLIGRHQRELGLKVHLEGESHLKVLTIEQSHVAYRMVQEALTNCIKHSSAKDLWICFTRGLETIEIDIKDNGQRVDSIGNIQEAVHSTEKSITHIQEGFGLKGMRERAKESGGSFTYAREDGFHLQMILPVELVEEEADR